MEEEQTIQWPKENVQKDKQQSTKHAYKTKDRVTRTPLKIGGWTQGKRGNRIYISPNETKIYGF